MPTDNTTKSAPAPQGGVSKRFATNLAQLLSEKLLSVYPKFPATKYIDTITTACKHTTSYSQRVQLHTDTLHALMPDNYQQTIAIFLQILGPENPNQTGMFKEYYRLLPIAKYVECYGLDHYDTSLHAISEITKRCTGEYAIRPFLQQHPNETIQILYTRAQSDNFHLRRLAAEGCRPKLPWAKKLDTFIDNPAPVFAILAQLMEDEIKFVQKSVANNIADYRKVNLPEAQNFLKQYQHSTNPHTQWIIKHATRKSLK